MRKANPAIAIRPTAGKLTIVSRRIYNLLLYHAQQQGIGQEEYSLPLAQIVAQTSTSENNATIKVRLREMASTTIEWNSNPTGAPGEQEWNIASLLAAKITPARNGCPITLTWSYAPGVRRELIEPKQYTRLLLQISSRLSLYSAAVLLEIGFQYLTSPGQLTMRESVDWWAGVLKGQPLKKPVDYRFFKRDTLMPGIREVNETQSEFELELIEHRDGRKVAELQFRVQRRALDSVTVDGPMTQDMSPEQLQPVDLELFAALQDLGMQEAEADSLMSSEPHERIRAAIAYTKARQGRIDTPAAYLRTVLRQGYADPETPSVRGSARPQSDESQNQAAVIARVAAERIELESLRRDHERELIAAARQCYADLADEAQIELQQQFMVTLTTARDRQSWKNNGLRSRPLEARFFGWMAHQDERWLISDGQLRDRAVARCT